MITFNFGSLVSASGRLRRERAITEVMAGFLRHCDSTSPPMKPVEPVTINFIFADGSVDFKIQINGQRSSFEGEEEVVGSEA